MRGTNAFPVTVIFPRNKTPKIAQDPFDFSALGLLTDRNSPRSSQGPPVLNMLFLARPYKNPQTLDRRPRRHPRLVSRKSYRAHDVLLQGCKDPGAAVGRCSKCSMSHAVVSEWYMIPAGPRRRASSLNRTAKRSNTRPRQGQIS